MVPFQTMRSRSETKIMQTMMRSLRHLSGVRAVRRTQRQQRSPSRLSKNGEYSTVMTTPFQIYRASRAFFNTLNMRFRRNPRHGKTIEHFFSKPKQDGKKIYIKCKRCARVFPSCSNVFDAASNVMARLCRKNRTTEARKVFHHFEQQSAFGPLSRD